MLRSMYAIPDNVADVIPVDTVINLMCAVAFKTAEQYSKTANLRLKKIPVYNCNSSTEKPVYWREMALNHWIPGIHKYPFENMIL